MKAIKIFLKYSVLTAAGIFLYCILHDQATAQRGYEAIGGEMFALFLPAIWAVIETSLRDWKQEIDDAK